MTYTYEPVERLPKVLSPGVVYHSEEYEVGAMLCACGCGHRVSLLVPDSHQIFSEGGMATIRPSISVCDAPCKSHYFISGGEVEWMPAFSSAMAEAVMRHQIARHVTRDAEQRSWATHIMAAAAKALGRLRSILRL